MTFKNHEIRSNRGRQLALSDILSSNNLVENIQEMKNDYLQIKTELLSLTINDCIVNLTVLTVPSGKYLFAYPNRWMPQAHC